MKILERQTGPKKKNNSNNCNVSYLWFLHDIHYIIRQNFFMFYFEIVSISVLLKNDEN